MLVLLEEGQDFQHRGVSGGESAINFLAINHQEVAPLSAGEDKGLSLRPLPSGRVGSGGRATDISAGQPHSEVPY
jgi:hypothetical protein